MKKISVIIPTYNAEKWLKKSFRTIINQTIFKELEVIYIDDGSTDNTNKLLNTLSKNYSNIKIITKPNGGVSSARNMGIDNSTCDYITFVDVDDYLENDYFESLFEYKEYDIVISGYVAEYNNKTNLNVCDDNKVFNSNVEIIEELIKNQIIDSNCWNKLYRRSIIDNIRFNEKLKYSEDYLFVFNYTSKCNNAIIIPIAKYHYVINNDSAMRKTFNENRFKSIEVTERITELIKDRYPELFELAKSREIDTKCRVLADLYYFNVKKQYKKQVNKLKKEIRKYGILKKKKFSSKKHFYAYVLIIINPYIYNFFKKKLNYEYKGR